MFRSLLKKLSLSAGASSAVTDKPRLELVSLARLMPDRLSQFQVFAGLDRDDMQLLADKLEPQSLPAGETLFSAGEDGEMDYLLLEGNLRLSAKCGDTRELVAGTERASRLVSGVYPYEYTAEAVTDCVYLALEPPVLAELMSRIYFENNNKRSYVLHDRGLARKRGWYP